MYQKLPLYDVQFLRYGARQMEGQIDGRTEKWHIEVGAPPKNFSSLSVFVKVALTKYFNSHWKMHFPAICSM